MTVLYYFNIALACMLLFWPLWSSRVYLRLVYVNPFTLLMIVTIPVALMKLFVGPTVLVDEGLQNANYQFALLMGNLYLIAQIVGTLFFLKVLVE